MASEIWDTTAEWDAGTFDNMESESGDLQSSTVAVHNFEWRYKTDNDPLNFAIDIEAADGTTLESASVDWQGNSEWSSWSSVGNVDLDQHSDLTFAWTMSSLGRNNSGNGSIQVRDYSGDLVVDVTEFIFDDDSQSGTTTASYALDITGSWTSEARSWPGERMPVRLAVSSTLNGGSIDITVDNGSGSSETRALSGGSETLSVDVDASGSVELSVAATASGWQPPTLHSIEVVGGIIPPTLESVTAPAENELESAWTKEDSESEGEFAIYRSTSSGAQGSQVSTPAVGTNTYTDTAVDDGTTYWVTVARVDTDGVETYSAQLSETTILPEPGSPTPTNITATSTDIAISNNADTGTYRVEYRRTSTSTWTVAESGLSRDTSTYTLASLLNGEAYDERVVIETSDAETPSESLSFTTALPNAKQPTLGNGVEDEITADWTDAINNGSYRVQIRVSSATTWDSSTPGFAEHVVDESTTATTFTGLLDGEEYEVRVRTETADAGAGAWTTPVAITTQFPGATGPQIAGTTATSLTVSWTDNSDNEDGFDIEVREELDPRRDTGFGSWETLATADPDQTSITLADLLANHDYQVRIRAFTEDASATSSTITGTTDVAIPSEGWYVVFRTESGDAATLSQPELGGDRPRLRPEISAIGRWRTDITKSDWLSEWLRSDARIYHDGSLWMRGPLTKYRPDGGSGPHARIEGLGVLDYLDAGGRDFTVSSEPGYQAIERFAADELSSGWTVSVTTPSTNTVREDWIVQDASTDSELSSLFQTTTTLPAAVNSTLAPQQTAFHANPYQESSLPVTTRSDFVEGTAAHMTAVGDSVAMTRSVAHTIPADSLGVAVRLTDRGSTTPEVEFRINGSVVDTLGQGAQPSVSNWHDITTGVFGGGSGYTGGDVSGTVDLAAEVTAQSGDEELAFDWVVLFDQRYHSMDSFPTSTDSDQHLPGPALYPWVDIPTSTFEQEYNIVDATISTSISDTSGNQRLQATIDSGVTWLPSGSTGANTMQATADFSAAEVFGTQIQGRVTLGPTSATRTDATPTQGYERQQLDAWQLDITTNALRVIDNQTYTGSPFDILTTLAEDSGMYLVPDYRADAKAAAAFAPGDETRDINWVVEDADPVVSAEDYYNKITVYGPEDSDGTRLSATASAPNEIDDHGEIAGPAKFRPDATSETELASIARSQLAQGLANRGVSGTLSISGRFVQPGYAYQVDAFEALDDRSNPRYVLQQAEFSWGEMRLDFEDRVALGILAGVRTDVEIIKRAL